MPVATRIALRFAFAWLLVSLVAWTALPSLAAAGHPVWGERATVWHLFVVGWLTQLIFGVALWFFPVLRDGPRRGSPRLAGVAVALLNLGVLARAVGEPLALRGVLTMQPVLGISAALQLVAGACIVTLLWPRVRGGR